MNSFLRNAVNRIRRFIRRGNPDSECVWEKVGVVFELNVYPLLQSPARHKVDDAICKREGLMTEEVYDGSFVIYNSTSRDSCTLMKFPAMQEITICRNNGLVTLDAESSHLVRFEFKDENLDNLPITPIRIHGSDIIFVRDCGQVASEWISDFLMKTTTGLRLGYFVECDYESFVEQNKDEWDSFLNSKSDPMNIHLKANNRYSILNLSSFDIINKEVSSVQNKLMESDFRPNIIIHAFTGYAFKEFNWKEIKIRNCTFECIESCNVCKQSPIHNFFKENLFHKRMFFTELRSQILESAGVNVEASAASLTIDMKLTGNGGPIQKGDLVYFRKK